MKVVSGFNNTATKYHERNRSTIFLPSETQYNTASANVNVSPYGNYVKKKREQTEPFQPIFTQENETVFERKIKEFYGTEKVSRTSSVPKSLGYLSKDLYTKGEDESNLTAKERKLKFLNPNIDTEKIKTVKKDPRIVDPNECVSKIKGESKHFIVDDKRKPKEIKQELYKSNIFHVQQKKLSSTSTPNPNPNTSTKISKSEKKSLEIPEHSDHPNPQKTILERTRELTKLDEWMKVNTELLFHTKPEEDKHEPPKKKKMRNLSSSFSIGGPCLTQEDQLEIKNIERKIARKSTEAEVTDNYNSTLFNEETQNKHQSYNNNQPKQFFKKPKEKFIDTYDLGDAFEISDFAEKKNFDFNDMKKVFIKNGIHIYDFISHAGNKVTFKVRKLDKNVQIRDKLISASKEISKKGFELKPTTTSYGRKPDNFIYTEVLRKCSLPDEHGVLNTEPNKQLKKDEKISNHMVDNRYKRGNLMEGQGKKAFK